MKNYTKEIKEILSVDFLKDKSAFLKTVQELNINAPYHDATFIDLAKAFVEIVDVLEESIEKNILDDISVEFRSNILTHLRNIVPHLNTIAVNKVVPDISIINLVNGNIIQLWGNVSYSSLAILTAKLPDLKKVQTKARELLNKIDESEITIQNALKVILEFDTKFKDVIEIHDAALLAKDSISQYILEIQEKKAKAEIQFNSINDFYNIQFAELLKKVTHEESGIDAIFNDFSKKHEFIKVAFSETNEHYQDIKGKIKTFNDTFLELDKIEDSIRLLQEKILDPEQGINSKAQYISSIKDKVDELYNKTKESFAVVSELETKVKQNHEKSEEKLHSIEFNAKKASDFLTDIENVYNVAIPKARGGIIDKTRKKFELQQWIWLTLLAGAVVSTTIVAYNLYSSFHDDASKGINADFIAVFLRYATLSPLIFIIVFCSRQYKSSRISFEKYTFKTVLSFSILAEIVELQKKFPDNKTAQSEILKFSIHQMNKLYDEPYYDEVMKLKTKMKMEEIKYGTFNNDEKKEGSNDINTSNEG